MALIRTHGFLSLLILLILSSLCFLLLFDLHWSRYMVQPPSLEYDSTDQVALTSINSLDSSDLIQLTQSVSQIKKQLINSTLPSSFKITLGQKFWSTIRHYPWFMKGGNLRPSSHFADLYSSLPIFPNDDPSSDRIVNQLMYIPSDYQKVLAKNNLKKIYLVDRMYSWNVHEVPLGQDQFISDKCPVNTCSITLDPNEAHIADAVIFKVNNRLVDMFFSMYYMCALVFHDLLLVKERH